MYWLVLDLSKYTRIACDFRFGKSTRTVRVKGPSGSTAPSWPVAVRRGWLQGFCSTQWRIIVIKLVSCVGPEYCKGICDIQQVCPWSPWIMGGSLKHHEMMEVPVAKRHLGVALQTQTPWVFWCHTRTYWNGLGWSYRQDDTWVRAYQAPCRSYPCVESVMATLRDISVGWIDGNLASTLAKRWSSTPAYFRFSSHPDVDEVSASDRHEVNASWSMVHNGHQWSSWPYETVVPK